MNTYHIIGSLNMDLATYITHFHSPGETILGEKLFTNPGGKGANQAVALARLGIKCKLFGKLGRDQYGTSYVNILKNEGIDETHIEVLDSTHTGLAIIEVERRTAQNRIIVIPGANALLDKEYIQKSVSTIIDLANTYPQDKHIVLLQLEIPLESVFHALELLSRYPQIISILDPAPAPHNGLPESIYRHIDYITPNESETKYLTGIDISTALKQLTPEQLEQDLTPIVKAGRSLTERGCRHVIIKAGKIGSFYISHKEHIFAAQQAHFNAVDTTAAGDSFNAGFAYALGNNMPALESLNLANRVAGLSTTKAGAQSAMPSLEMVGL